MIGEDEPTIDLTVHQVAVLFADAVERERPNEAESILRLAFPEDARDRESER